MKWLSKERASLGSFSLAGVTLAAAALVFLALSYRLGIQRGYDRVIPAHAWAEYSSAIGAVLTQQRHGIGRYAVADPVQAELDAKSLSPWETASLDSALLSLFRGTASGSQDQPVRLSPAANPGIVDYVDLSFALFGYQVRALYYTFYLLLAVSLTIAIIERRRSLVGLTAISLATAGLMIAALFSPGLQPLTGNLESPIHPRFLASLGIVPFLHIACLLIERADYTPGRLAVVVAQALVILFVWHISGASGWVPATLLLLAVLGAGHRWIVSGRRRARGAVASQWPALAVLTVLAVGVLLTKATAHPAYREAAPAAAAQFSGSALFGAKPALAYQAGRQAAREQGRNMRGRYSKLVPAVVGLGAVVIVAGRVVWPFVALGAIATLGMLIAFVTSVAMDPRPEAVTQHMPLINTWILLLASAVVAVAVRLFIRYGWTVARWLGCAARLFLRYLVALPATLKNLYRNAPQISGSLYRAMRGWPANVMRWLARWRPYRLLAGYLAKLQE